MEAMDWAAMLYRMYVRFCERKGWEVEPADMVAGEDGRVWFDLYLPSEPGQLPPGHVMVAEPDGTVRVAATSAWAIA